MDEAIKKPDGEADVLFAEACCRYAAAVEIAPKAWWVPWTLADTLRRRSLLKDGEEERQLLLEARDALVSALLCLPNESRLLVSLGMVFHELADASSGEEALSWHRVARVKLEASLELDPNNANTLQRLGATLTDLANAVSGQESDRLFELVYEKHDEAAKLDPEEPEIPYSWGCALDDQAKRKQGKDAARLLRLVCVKYEKAIDLKPDYYEALHNWGNALSRLASLTGEEEAVALNEQAENLYLRAVDLGSDFSAWVLAGIAAGRGDEEQCRRWLLASVHLGFLEKGDGDMPWGDPHFAHFRDKRWFRELVSELGFPPGEELPFAHHGQ